MKILKITLIVLAGVLVIALITSLMMKKDYSVEKEVVVNKPLNEVFDYIKHLKNQDTYSVWAKMDPKMRKTFSGEDATVGFVSAWDSDVEDVGSGEQEITKIIEDQRVEFELRFFEPFESTEVAYMRVEKITENETKVFWGIKGHLGVPGNLFMFIINFEEMIGNDLQNGLENLKSVLEAK